ncbi:MAG: hypothetical protein LBU87_04635 [Lactobacillales bacterium]|jgi:hypothetical protein|nr:hypothetical protein [Lactobacillales bacterium]
MTKIIFLILFLCPLVVYAKTVHVLVALCDNWHQRIYPVPLKLGNGNDPENNLYWGAMYGVKTFFKNDKNWVLVQEIRDPAPDIMRRAVFKHKPSDTWMVADAYRGSKIKRTIEDFLDFTAGDREEKISVSFGGQEKMLAIGGGADLIAYVGHNGLMDFSLNETPAAKNEGKRETVILACYSKSYFQGLVEKAGGAALVWTRGKMAPEAYVLRAVLESWAAGKTKAHTNEVAAKAYAKYQKISEKAAQKLFY